MYTLTYLSLVAIYILFLIASIILFKAGLSVKGRIYYLYFLVYLVGIYYYFDLINFIHYRLRDNGIYLQFGHANFLLLCDLALSYLTAIIMGIILSFRRNTLWKLQQPK
jgi:signal transduction histidine kinase